MNISIAIFISERVVYTINRTNARIMSVKRNHPDFNATMNRSTKF